MNLVQSVQEGRDGTGETAVVSEAFTLSLSASAPWTWSSRSRRAVTVRKKRRGSVRPLPWAWAPPPREPGPVGPGGPWRYGKKGVGQWGLYLELERLRPVNLVHPVQEGRDGTGETAGVSEAFTLSLSASVPWTWSTRSRRAATVREKRRGSVRPLPWVWAPPSREPGPVGPGAPWRYGRNDAGQWGPPHQAGDPVQQHRSTWKIKKAAFRKRALYDFSKYEIRYINFCSTVLYLLCSVYAVRSSYSHKKMSVPTVCSVCSTGTWFLITHKNACVYVIQYLSSSYSHKKMVLYGSCR